VQLDHSIHSSACRCLCFVFFFLLLACEFSEINWIIKQHMPLVAFWLPPDAMAIRKGIRSCLFARKHFFRRRNRWFVISLRALRLIASSKIRQKETETRARGGFQPRVFVCMHFSGELIRKKSYSIPRRVEVAASGKYQDSRFGSSGFLLRACHRKCNRSLSRQAELGFAKTSSRTAVACLPEKKREVKRRAPPARQHRARRISNCRFHILFVY
jgi:hypothetical protein